MTNLLKKIVGLPWKVKIPLLIVVVFLVWFAYKSFLGTKSDSTQYQTAKVERGTLVVSITASGTVSTANNVQVTTEASGVVTNIFVTNGQPVRAGQAIAELELDMEGQQRQLQALASYNSAKNNLLSLQSTMLSKWKTYMDVSQSSSYQNSDGSAKTDARTLPAYMVTNNDWLVSEEAYKNQQNTINQSAIAYQQSSPIIYAPISGTLTGFALQKGSVVTAQSNSSGGSTAQKIASVKTEATPTVTVSLTEIDVPKVKVGNKATVTLDAFSGKTFAGEVVSVDTVGSVSSGVTTYPTVIKLVAAPSDVFTNMSAEATVITDYKDNVLIVPSSAITTQNGESSVKVLQNGQPSMVNVQTGIYSSTQTEIISGLNDNDEVVTATISSTKSSTGTTGTQSVFGSLGGGNRNIGGGAVRIQGR